jgi:formate dehydrogenase maturation protein FdhE
MASLDQFIERAVRLSALAAKTHEEGHLEFAKVLARLATESYEKAAKLKRAQQASDTK